jgi:hypothetical protein
MGCDVTKTKQLLPETYWFDYFHFTGFTKFAKSDYKLRRIRFSAWKNFGFRSTDFGEI